MKESLFILSVTFNVLLLLKFLFEKYRFHKFKKTESFLIEIQKTASHNLSLFQGEDQKPAKPSKKRTDEEEIDFLLLKFYNDWCIILDTALELLRLEYTYVKYKNDSEVSVSKAILRLIVIDCFEFSENINKLNSRRELEQSIFLMFLNLEKDSEEASLAPKFYQNIKEFNKEFGALKKAFHNLRIEVGAHKSCDYKTYLATTASLFELEETIMNGYELVLKTTTALSIIMTHINWGVIRNLRKSRSAPGSPKD